MRHLLAAAPTTFVALTLLACGGQKPAPAEPSAPSESASSFEREAADESRAESSDEGAAEKTDVNEFVVNTNDSSSSDKPKTESKIKGSKTEAALKLVVIDKDKGPIPGVVISLTSSDGKKFYADETNAEGYTELLVPVGKKYQIVYLSLGRTDIAASVPVTSEANQNIRLTLRYKRWEPTPEAKSRGIVLEGVNFDTGKATLRPESFPQFDNIVEYMTHKKSARVEISGHTDNVGNPKTNKALSKKRAEACRDYLVSKGIEKSRIEAVGYGDEQPIASNDTEEGRQQNRRIEAFEL